MINCWRILRRHLAVFRRTWWSNIMFNFIEPFLYLSAFGTGIGAFVTEMEGMSYMQFVASGTVASCTMWAATFECTYGSFIRMDFQKTFHAMLVTPLTVRDVVLGEALFGAFKSMVFSAIILVVIAALGQVQSWWAILLPVLNLLPGLGFAFLALGYSSSISHIDNLNYYITLAMTPLLLVSGVFFPVSTLPAWLQTAAFFNPLYHTVVLSRMLIRGEISPDTGIHLMALLVFTVVVSLPPVYLMRKRLIQ